MLRCFERSAQKSQYRSQDSPSAVMHCVIQYREAHGSSILMVFGSQTRDTAGTSAGHGSESFGACYRHEDAKTTASKGRASAN